MTSLARAPSVFDADGFVALDVRRRSGAFVDQHGHALTPQKGSHGPQRLANFAGLKAADEAYGGEFSRHARIIPYLGVNPSPATEENEGLVYLSSRNPSRGGFLYNSAMLDKRAQTLLKTLIERYIVEGQPVGSRTLSRHSGLELSPATIRNVMSDLEEMGFITQPAHLGRAHSDCAGLPSFRRYPAHRQAAGQRTDISELQGGIQISQPQLAINTASQLLSQLTQFAGVVIVPRRPQTRIRQVEFLSRCPKSACCLSSSPWTAMCRTASCIRSATTAHPN